MKEDKITAMWEEDGDLMRIKNFFEYLHQDDDLKDRIKQKALSKISSADNPIAFTPETAGKSLKKNPLRKISYLFKNKKSVIKVISAAAIVIFAIYLGTAGLLMGNNSPLKVGTATSNQAMDKAYSVPAGGSAASPAPSVAPSAQDDLSVTFSAAKGVGQSSNAADSTYGTDALKSAATENNVQDGAIQQKLIYTLDVAIKANNVSAAMEAVQQKVKSVGGYIAESSFNNDQDQASAYLSLKIPVNQFESFKGNLSQFGSVTNQHLATNDVSKDYFDTQTRLSTWEAQEKRYLEILQQAKSVEDILRIEGSLVNVRSQIESLKGQLKYWDNQVEYSEVRMNISPSQSTLAVNDPWQPISIKHTLITAKNAMVKTISFVWNAINYILVFIGYALPVIIILGADWGIWFLYKRHKK